VFETSASTNSAIWAIESNQLAQLQCKSMPLFTI